ncbi:Protein CBG10623 [Caenorhabditis briggsae]|uniref:Protein CBG10623 n=1 Tax=Caenorhabditis briggsae TaxID=6238 RepID=A8XBH3_CAEBR|nr:Protein CBG10623 [Caenorhabditis briggsae]CAP29988.2 Protein CBG10623 [Caenorhabditis briggsae]
MFKNRILAHSYSYSIGSYLRRTNRVHQHQFHLTAFKMMFRILLAFCLFSTAASVTLVICQQYCSSVQGAASYDNCAPWNSYALASNQTCYNLCVHNCAAVYDGSCMTGDGFKSKFTLLTGQIGYGGSFLWKNGNEIQTDILLKIKQYKFLLIV